MGGIGICLFGEERVVSDSEELGRGGELGGGSSDVCMIGD